MADEDRDEGGGESIFKVDTVPPPAGDGDAYNAPTKVGPAAAAEWEALIKEADEKGRKAAKDAEAAGVDSARPNTTAIPKPSKPPADLMPPAPAALDGEVPRVYNEEVEESEAATMLHPSAKAPIDTSARADASAVFGGTPTAASAPPAPVSSNPIISSSPASASGASSSKAPPPFAALDGGAEPNEGGFLSRPWAIPAIVFCLTLLAVGLVLAFVAH